MKYQVVEENTNKLAVRWLPEINTVQIKRTRNFMFANQIARLMRIVYAHPWTWCSL